MVARWEVYFTHGSEQAKLPDWCHCYLRLGAFICRTCESDRRLVLAVAAPTRAYAAVLTATGLVIERLRAETEAADSRDHIEMLRGIEKGTPVVIHSAVSKTKGVFVGIRDRFHDGQTYVGVQVAGPGGRDGGLTRWLPPQLAGSVAVLETITGRSVKLPRASRSEELVKNQRFVSHFLSLHAQRVLATKSRVECAIVGQVGRLKWEAVDTSLAVPRDDQAVRRERSERNPVPAKEPLPRLARGCLQDILKVQRFCKDDEAFRSTVIPGTTEPQVAGKESGIVLFDGATGFLKWRQCWPEAHYVLLLDRTDPYFFDAVSLVNTGFANRVGEAGVVDLGILPAGAEAISYWDCR